MPDGARRVAFVLHGFSGGGMERSMLRLAEAFLARGLAVDFVVGQAKGELLAEFPKEPYRRARQSPPLWQGRRMGSSPSPAPGSSLLRLEFKAC